MTDARDALKVEVLKMVDKISPCHKSDVMRAFGHHEKTIFNILNELLEDGLIKFSPADEYGSRFLGLTDEGRETLDTRVRVRKASEESR